MLSYNALHSQYGVFMKKALHDKNDVFFTFRKGELLGWKAHDVEMLLAAANDAPVLEHEERKNGYTIVKKDGVVVTSLSSVETFCLSVNDLMSDLVDEGVTVEMIDDINTVLFDIRYIHVLMLSDSGTPYWQNNIADMNRAPSEQEAAYYAFAHQLAIGGLEGLKRCQLSDCEKFFIGRPDAKWCSKSCGSKYRVRKKRKKDFKRRFL